MSLVDASAETLVKLARKISCDEFLNPGHKAEISKMCDELSAPENMKYATKDYSNFIFTKMWTCLSEGEHLLPKPQGFERIWSSFEHACMEADVEAEFQNFVNSTGCTLSPRAVVYFHQSLLTAVMETILSARCHINSNQIASCENKVSVTKSEQATLHYVAGYIVYKLTRHFRRYPNNSASKVGLAILQTWQASKIDGTYTGLCDYVSQWTLELNRGGLRVVTMEVFALFCALESVVKVHLHHNNLHMLSKNNVRHLLTSAINKDDDVNDIWDSLLSNVEHETVSSLLYTRIVKSFVNVRCSAFCKAYVMLKKKKDDTVSRTGERSLRSNLSVSGSHLKAKH